MWLFDTEHVPQIQTDLPGPNARKLLDRDTQVVSQSYTRVYPLVVEQGSGAVIRDVDGNLFLDFTAGIAVCTTGHCHPEVVESIRDQAGKLIHMSGTDFYYTPQIELAERLAALAPGDMPKKVFFSNSGAEAVESALKLSRHHTHRSRIVAFFGAFHGRTYGAMSLTASKLPHRRGFSPLVPDVHHVPFPRDCGLCDDTTSCACLREIEEVLFHRTAPPDEVAAIFIEPVQGEGGYHVAPSVFLQGLRALCDKHGILLVFDEVQSGMGRTGKMFAAEYSGVVPDIICVAKGIASGLPLGAIVAKSEVMDWPPGSHASTFGGNPIACRAALTTIDLLEREYMANAATRGRQLRDGLRELTLRHGELGNVRGLGLMTAVDVLTPNGDPDPKGREAVVQGAFQRGLLLLGCGESGVRFCPPLCVTEEQVETCLKLLDEVLVEVNTATVV
ncbi:MAG TPA: acetyl ornithine aminotransferase family protein [Gemmataceae bacterium]|jgi:4-aminobutyrate aminotransferase|nr:acetyl ornithine aminotransferase family protein [Gemmataceae bacterium]